MINIIDVLHTQLRVLRSRMEPRTDRAVYEFDVEPSKVAAVAGTEIIQNAHSGVPMKIFRKTAADKSGTSSDQDSHR